jgi:type I restriction enzyme S subunit
VAKIEELLARVNAARERLVKVKEILKRFRQSVLASACSGRLTADWRDENENLESAKQLLNRVCRKRQEHYKAECKKAKAESKKAPKMPHNLEPRKVKIVELPNIPAEWAWVYLPDLGYMNRGKSRHRPRNASHLYGGPYPFIQTGDIAQSAGRIISHRQTYSEAGLAQSRMWPANTVCITIAANIANSAILTYPACFPDSIVGVAPDEELCLAEYLEYFIRTAQTDLDQFAPATSQKNINIGILSDVAVPLPPFSEQKEIVHRVEALFKLSDTIEKRLVDAAADTQKLTQAILAKAFRGELVATEAELAQREGRSYEPASTLLAKIKAQRKDVKPQRKRGRALQRRNNISSLAS